jgi:hypothetical protein
MSLLVSDSSCRKWLAARAMSGGSYLNGNFRRKLPSMLNGAMQQFAETHKDDDIQSLPLHNICRMVWHIETVQ